MESIRGTYEEFIKGGGLFISKLLCLRTPALYRNGTAFDIPIEYMLTLYSSDDVNLSVDEILAEYDKQFIVNDRIERLYNAVEAMCNYLPEVDMGSVPKTYQHAYPELILKTYGDGIDTLTDANLSISNKSGRLSYIRKTATNLLLDLICQNDYFKIIDYEFGGREALETISFIMQAIEASKDAEILKKTLETFKRIHCGESEQMLANNLNELLLAVDLFIDIGKQLSKSNVKLLPTGKARIETGTYRLTTKYKLYIDGMHVASSQKPSFVVEADIVKKSKIIRIVPIREVDDWFLVLNRARLARLHNKILDITDSASNGFTIYYRAAMLAGGSIKVIRDHANPKVYDKIMREITEKYNKPDSRKCVWPLACIYTVCDYNPKHHENP